MNKDSMFIVIEGLDGSGKTSVSRQLAYFLHSLFEQKVKLTFEPNDPSCAGLFIRQILEKKIVDFSHETLALAFAANRMDHCDRQINNWLNKGTGRIVICDRYYLSSLVYQSNENQSFEDIMDLNKHARKPDLIFFLNVSNEVCYERMEIRNKPKELFEEQLSSTREKYFEAISFLKTKRKEHIVNIDASGTIEQVLSEMVKAIFQFRTDWKEDPLELLKSFNLLSPFEFAANGKSAVTIDEIIASLHSILLSDKLDFNKKNEGEKIALIRSATDRIFDDFDFDRKGAIFLNFIQSLGYTLGSKLPGTYLDAYEIRFEMPGNLSQKGTALLINEPQKYDAILGSVSGLKEMSDFMFVFSPGSSVLVTKYFERDIIKNANNENAIFPSTRIVSEADLKDYIIEKFNEQYNLSLT